MITYRNRLNEKRFERIVRESVTEAMNHVLMEAMGGYNPQSNDPGSEGSLLKQFCRGVNWEELKKTTNRALEELGIKKPSYTNKTQYILKKYTKETGRVFNSEDQYSIDHFNKWLKQYNAKRKQQQQTQGEG